MMSSDDSVLTSTHEGSGIRMVTFQLRNGGTFIGMAIPEDASAEDRHGVAVAFARDAVDRQWPSQAPETAGDIEGGESG